MSFSWSDLKRLATAGSLKSWPRWWRAVEAGAAEVDPGSALWNGLYEVWANAVTGGEAGAYRWLGPVVGALRARLDGFASERLLPGTLAALPEVLAVLEVELVYAAVATHFLPPPEDAGAMARRVEAFYRDCEDLGWQPWNRPLPDLSPSPFLPADPETLAQLRAVVEALPSDRADLRAAIVCLRGYLQAQQGIVVTVPLPVILNQQGAPARLLVRFLPGSRPAPYRLTGSLSERQREWLEWNRLWCRFPLPWHLEEGENKTIRLLWSLKGAGLAAQGLLDQAGLDYQVKDECLDLYVTGFTVPLGGDSLGLAVALAILARAYGSPLGLATPGDAAPTGSFAPPEAVKWLAENQPGIWEANRKARETWAERVYLQREIGPVGHLEAKVAACQAAGLTCVLPAALPPEGKAVPEGPGVRKVATLDQAAERLLLDPWQGYLDRFPAAPVPDVRAETPLARFLSPIAQAHGGSRWLHFAADPQQTAAEACAMLAALYRTVCSQPRVSRSPERSEGAAKGRSDGTLRSGVPDYKPRVPLALSAAEVAPTDTPESLVRKALAGAVRSQPRSEAEWRSEGPDVPRGGPSPRGSVPDYEPFIPRAVREGRFLFCFYLVSGVRRSLPPPGGEPPASVSGVRRSLPPPGGEPPALFADGGPLARLREPTFRENGVLLIADRPESVADLADRLADFSLLEPPPEPDPTAWRDVDRDPSRCRYLPLRPAAPLPGPLTLEPVGESVPAYLLAVGRVREEVGNQVVTLCNDGEVVVYDADLRPLAQWPTSTQDPFWRWSLGLIDTTGNGFRDVCLVAPEPLEVRVYDGHGGLLRTLPAPPHKRPWTHASIMGVDDGHGGGTPRIFVHWDDFGQARDIHHVLAAYEARRPERFRVRPWGALRQRGVAVGDLTGNGRRTELIVDNYSWSNGSAPEVDGVVQGPDWHTFVLALNDRGEFLFPPRSLGGSFATTQAGVADLDGDGCDEVVLLTSAGSQMAQSYSALRVLRRDQEVACREYRGLALTSLAVAPRTKTRSARLLVSNLNGELHVFDDPLHEIRSLLCGRDALEIAAVGDFDSDGALEALVYECTRPALLVVDDWDTGPAAYHRVPAGPAEERFEQVVLTDLTGQGELTALAVLSRRAEAGETHRLCRWRFVRATTAAVTPPDQSPSLECYDVSGERAQPLRCDVVPRIRDVRAWAWSPRGTWRACVVEVGEQGSRGAGEQGSRGAGMQGSRHPSPVTRHPSLPSETLGTLDTLGTLGTFGAECVLLDVQGWPQHRWPVPRAELYHLRWSPSESRLALMGTAEQAFGPTVLAVCDVESGTVWTREVPDCCGLNLAWLPDFGFRISDFGMGNLESEIGVAVQLGRLGQDERGRPITESAGLWRWTFATDEWEPLLVPGLSESAYLLADGLEGGAYAFFDPATTALLLGTLSEEFPTSAPSPGPQDSDSRHSSLVTRHSSLNLFDPSQMTDLLIAPDALLNLPDVRQAWLMDGDTLHFAVRPDDQARRIAGAVAPDGRRLAVPMMMRHLDAIDPHYRHYILRDLWLFAAGERPRQLTYRDDLNLRRPVWDPTGRLIAVEARRLDRFEPITEVWVVRVADRRMFYVGPGEQPQWDPRQAGRLLAFLRDGVICYVAAPAEWLTG